MEDNTDDIQLIRRLAQGDLQAFDLLYLRHRAPLFTFLVRLTQDRTLAEDLLQETWLRLATRAKDLRPDTRPAAWLFTVARNLFLSHHRRLAVRRGRLPFPGPWSAVGVPGQSPFTALLASEQERRLENALARLPHRDREVILLIAVSGLPHHDAARICGTSTHAMRKRFQRAKDRLAHLLAERGPTVDSPATTQPTILLKEGHHE